MNLSVKEVSELADILKNEYGIEPAAAAVAAPAAAGGAATEDNGLQQALGDLETINAHLFSIEVLMERIFDVRVPEAVEQKFQELAGELAPRSFECGSVAAQPTSASNA